MKIVYMGTPQFAVAPLAMLVEEGHQVGYVVTQADKERDRGKKLQPTEVKAKALELGLPILQPDRVKGNAEFYETLKNYAPDLIVVAAYGKLLPKEILQLPTLGCINIHASLLPRFRGAAPIQRSIIEGDVETGITLMYMEEGLDTGDMLAVSKTFIERKTAAQLHDELAEMGAELLRENLPTIQAGGVQRQKQDDSLATYAPMLFKKDGQMDFSQKPEALERLVRGLDPWPGAYTSYQGQPLKIWAAEVPGEKTNAESGTITEVSSSGIEIAAAGEILLATIIQMPGKKRMAVSDYLKGNKIEKNIILG